MRVTQNEQLVIPKKHFLQGEAQNQYGENACKATHSDSERKSLLYFDTRIIENQWFYMEISLSHGLWKVHFCNMIKTQPHDSASKTHIKPKLLQFPSKRPQNDIIQVLFTFF